jgi:hypothetical protein
MEITRQQKDFYKSLSQHGSRDNLVKVGAKDIILLIHIAYLDVHENRQEWFIAAFYELATKNFYDITPVMGNALPNKTEEDAIWLLKLSGATNTENVIYLYLKNLAELYRKRYKFYDILKKQPFPVAEQIRLRCLLEYGNCADNLLFSWMSWRKWIYDIDNRSAQETGYLFESILISCLGGESVSSSNSPVKRISENGIATQEGRQIDCYIEDKKEVYELKLRVTIAASGQGRFSEEMSFPYEAKMAGIKPILVVFDSTPSLLLDKLKAKYEEAGGYCVVGKNAWDLLINRAGHEMGKYILKYIKPLIDKMESKESVLPTSIHLKTTVERLTIYDDNGFEYIIPRNDVSE